MGQASPSPADSRSALGPDAQPRESGRHGEIIAADSEPPTRHGAIKQVLGDASVCERVGAAWRLFFRLLVAEEGKVIGTHDQIGEALGVSGNTARNWIGGLVAAGLAHRAASGRSVEVTLAEPYISMSRRPKAVQPATAVAAPADTPRMALLRTVADAAEKADTKIRVEMVI